MIDKNGKLFGIVNAIDLLTVLIIASIIIFFVQRSKTQDVIGVSSQAVRIKIYSEGYSSFITDYINIGDNIEDSDKNLFLGQIEEINIFDGFMYIYDKNGNLNKSKKDGYDSIEIVATVEAQVSENGITIDGNKYGVGHSLNARVGKGKIFAKISGIELIHN